MFRDLRAVNLWNVMKKDIARYVARCGSCQQVKVEGQRLGGLAQDIEIPTSKCVTPHKSMHLYTNV